jgi:hypothetical protein
LAALATALSREIPKMIVANDISKTAAKPTLRRFVTDIEEK